MLAKGHNLNMLREILSKHAKGHNLNMLAKGHNLNILAKGHVSITDHKGLSPRILKPSWQTTPENRHTHTHTHSTMA